MAKEKTREEIIAELKEAELEEGRTGLVEEYLKNNPEPKPEEKKKKDKK